MKIKSIQLDNFKRFTNLHIEDIGDDVKLVLLIGSNGSGKSSVFDAFELANSTSKDQGYSNHEYYRKNKFTAYVERILFNNKSEISINDSVKTTGPLNQYLFYGRTSFRQVPRLTRTSLGSNVNVNFNSDTDRPRAFIDRDGRFENDLEKITEDILKDLFRSDDTKQQIRKRYITPINDALTNIFGHSSNTALKLIEIIPPLEGKTAQVNFQKGNSEIHYDYLSAGEKEVFNILINLLSRSSLYQDSIYFLDEIDLHLNTMLQYALLKEITENWVPENCQLWVASHSLGFIDYAHDYEQAAIIDFDDLDFDSPQVLTPLSKEKLSVYDVAIPKATISKILKGYKLVVVENKNDEHYNLALGEDGYLFLPANNNREVFLTIKNDKEKLGLRDKDYLRPDEVESIQAAFPNLKILSFYAFENYLYHPDNIEELQLHGFDKAAYTKEIIEQKNEKMLSIVGEIGTSRSHYIEFKEGIKNDGDIEPIIEALKSDLLADFYPYFNVKKFFGKTFLKDFNITTESLASTKWFKKSIESILQ
jgi:AAA15 family ATPase/GTPase